MKTNSKPQVWTVAMRSCCNLIVLLVLMMAAIPSGRLFAGEGEAIKLRCIQPPNLVRNADFKQIDKNGLPRGWRFDNCSQSPHFKSKIIRNETVNYLAVNTDWIKFGYWLQNIPVKEGASYYVGCEVQSDDPTVAVWLQCQAEKKNVQKKSSDQIEHLFYKTTSMGDESREVLKDFVDEDLIVSMSARQWIPVYNQIVIPAGLGIRFCTMRIGIYGGNAGQARFRNPVFREAQCRLEAEISGTGWTLLRVPGAKPESVKLDPSAKQQTVSVILPKAKRIYKVELCGQKGGKITKEVPNE
ncbi:MAG: hypothetical protein J5806_15090 [Lentisphaeria bacterium]|nr:hypothetical protein [Lentisphaeria bacterium]